MTCALITGMGGDLAQSVARLVRAARPSWRLVGTDLHDQHAGLLLVDHFERLPLAEAPDYVAALEDVVERHRVDFILPMVEAELRVLHRSLATAVGRARLLATCHASLAVGLDKVTTADFLASLSIPGPWTLVVEHGVAPPELPCIYKPRASSGSRGVAILRTTDEVEAHWDDEPRTAIFQELLLPDDREVTCPVYRDAGGATFVLVLLRRLVDGITSWARVVECPEAVEQCTRIAAALDVHGFLNVQMRLTERGPRIFEINPRISSTVEMRSLLGFTDVEWMLDELDGRRPAGFDPPFGAEVARLQVAALLPGRGNGAATLQNASDDQDP